MESIKLYHYTTESGCQNIIDSGELWLSDVNSLDDGNEIIKRFKIFRQQIECSKSFEKLSHKNRTRFLNFIIDRLIEDEFFIACFCLSKTNKHLWEHYSNKYTGKCLEFEIPLPRGEDRLFALQALPMSYRDLTSCEDLQASLDKSYTLTLKN